MSFNVSEEEAWKTRYKKIWSDVESQLFEKLATEPIKGNKVRGKLKTWKKDIKTNFHGRIVPYCTCCNATAVLKIIDQHVYDQRLMDDTLRRLAWDGLQKTIVRDDDRMIDKRTGEVLNPEVDSTYWKDKF